MEENVIRWGWSGMSHDAALAVMVDEELVYASHSERYSRVKNDKNIHTFQVYEALHYGYPDEVYYYETPWLKKWRQWRAGQRDLIWKPSPSSHMKQFEIHPRSRPTRHHHSHAAYGFYTAPFGVAEVLVIDSIGEWETMTWWHGNRKGLHKRNAQNYPDSVGLWYTAMTQRLGIKPQEHEYILMGMAATGDPDRFHQLILNDFFHVLPHKDNFNVVFKRNLHCGCQDWRPDLNTVQDLADIAAATQRIYEDIFEGVLQYIRERTAERSIVVVGGCALNCVANRLAFKYFNRVYIPANPGDAGSSVGAILAHTKQSCVLGNAYLGTDIPGDYPVDDVIDDLLTTGVSAVASGRAEFGPRALGNRSILADPRLLDVKDRVNKLKQRESFRPFAPAILAGQAHKYFHMPESLLGAPYMQYAFKCREPDKYPGIVHSDDTSRVQTVHLYGGGFRKLLEEWQNRTGCPMLLNTSLNVCGEPLVNSFDDAKRWSKLNSMPVRTPR